MKKFELTENSINWKGRTLYQIKACKAFITSSGIEINEGELGGWIEKEENLSQRGKAWIWGDTKIYDAAKIYGNAEIWGEAQICGKAEVFGNAQIYGNTITGGNVEVFGNAQIYGNAEISGYAKVCDNAQICSDAKIGGDAFISSPDNILTVTPLGRYRVSLSMFKTKENSIKVSYNWDIYTLEKFQSVMNDWTEEEVKIAKAIIEVAKVAIKF